MSNASPGTPDEALRLLAAPGSPLEAAGYAEPAGDAAGLRSLAAPEPPLEVARDLPGTPLVPTTPTRPSALDKASIVTGSTVTATGFAQPPAPSGPAPPAAAAATAQSALQWLLSAEISEVRHTLALAATQRPSLFKGLGPAEESLEMLSPPYMKLERMTSVSSFDDSTLRKSDAEAMAKELPIVQFTASVYFCHESESEMVIDVARLGNQSITSEVSYATENVTALAGVRYQKTEGRLVFEAGETQKELRVPLFFTPDWEPTTEFLVMLVKDPAPSGCVLGRYLHRARVKVIDGGTFPSPKFDKEVADEKISEIPKWQLLFAYISLNFRDPVVRKGTIRMVFLDISHNIYFLLTLLMNVYLVDNVIGNADDDPYVPLLAIAALLVVPFMLFYIFDGKRLTWRVSGGSRKMLQGALLRKYLNYSEVFRQNLNRGDVVLAMTRDAVWLVDYGYSGAIDLAHYVGQLFAILLFQALAPSIFGLEFTPIPLIISGVFPLLLLGFEFARREVTTRVVLKMSKLQDDLVAQCDRIVTNYPIISDYNRRPFFVTRYENCIKEYNASEVTAKKVLKDNLYFAKWLQTIAVAFYTVMGGSQAQRQDIGVGMFLANIAVIQTIGSCMEAIYSIFLDMQSIFPAMENMTRLLNAPIDLPERMAINRARRQTTTLLRARAASDHDIGLPIDRLTIKAVNVNFDVDPRRTFSSTGELEVRQGQLVSLVGPKGEGKSTLLKVLGGVTLPKPDVLFIPSHLRGLHISSEPLFFKGSLFENLTFGVACDEDGEQGRVGKICSRLGLPQSVLNLVDLGMDGEPQPWSEVLSYTQRCLLCLARAIIANPELMFVHKPTMPFDEEVSIKILTLFREFCEKKGVEMDDATRHMRRPRTCIMTSSKLLGVKMSDEVYIMSRKEGIRRAEKDKVEANMLN